MTTMNEKYGDGSDHKVCATCGLCIDCGDCKTSGCGRREAEEVRTALIKTLSKHVCEIEFVKVDGSVRKMTGTLLEEMLPQKKEGTKPHAINTDTVRVYDLEKEGWRSFRVDSLRSITTKD